MTTSGSLIWWYPISLSPPRRKRSPLQSNNRPSLMPVKALKPRLQLRLPHPIQQRLCFQIYCTSLSLLRSPVLSVFLHPLRALGSTTITTWASQSVKGEFFAFQEDEKPNASPVRSSLFWVCMIIALFSKQENVSPFDSHTTSINWFFIHLTAAKLQSAQGLLNSNSSHEWRQVRLICAKYTVGWKEGGRQLEHPCNYIY